VEDRRYNITAIACARQANGDVRVSADIEGQQVTAFVRAEDDRVAVWLEGEWHRFDRVSRAADAAAHIGEGTVRAPMPGVVLAVHVRESEHVRRGQTLIVLEAMKMEHTLSAGAAGVVSELRVGSGDRVREGDPLLRISEPST
jgi:biotin carboxyl carrier protein